MAPQAELGGGSIGTMSGDVGWMSEGSVGDYTGGLPALLGLPCEN